MPDTAIFAAVGAYAFVAVLMLSLNFASLWSWKVKSFAVVATSALFFGTYFAIANLLGFPSNERLPERASFLASRIVEPDKVTGDPGAIFVWLQDLDAEDLPVGEPRAYRLDYRREVASEVIEAQRLRFQGREVVGNFSYEATPEDPQAAPAAAPSGIAPTEMRQVEDRRTGGGTFSLNQDLHAHFEEMPLLPLPDKLPIIESY